MQVVHISKRPSVKVSRFYVFLCVLDSVKYYILGLIFTGFLLRFSYVNINIFYPSIILFTLDFIGLLLMLIYKFISSLLSIKKLGKKYGLYYDDIINSYYKKLRRLTNVDLFNI